MTNETKTAEKRENSVRTLRANGSLRSRHWTEAFAQVPREQFVTQFAVPHHPGPRLVHYDLSKDQDGEALAAVYEDATLITQWDAGGTAISSSSTPSLMATMLEHLDADPGHRVLEVGTGTGYNAALLCHALGSDTVTSIDLDATLVDHATRRLHTLGYTPHTAAVDGRSGYPTRAPFDRVIATCGFDRVPNAWLSQLSDHAVVVVNLGIGLAVLRGDPTGICGPFVSPAAFMTARHSNTDTAVTARQVVQATQNLPAEADRTAPGLDPETFADPAMVFLRSLHTPALRWTQLHDTEAGTTYCLYDPTREALARVQLHGDSASVTTQGVDLWDEQLAIATSWDGHGRPELTRYGLTVQNDGTHLLWLDEPTTITATVHPTQEA